MIGTIRERFDAKWIPVPFTGCWLWTAYIWPDTGYGCFSISHRKTKQAHIVGYRIYRGQIPEGLELDHLCRVRSCVNAWHLETVTRRINLLRGDTFNAKNAAVTHCPKGHPYAGDNLYIRKTGERGCRICRRQARINYDLRKQEIERILNGRRDTTVS